MDLGPVHIIIARHFGFCYGVENAIEISYRALEENPGKRIFLLSQMIHNPVVNEDLENKGIRFIMDTQGNHFIKWEDLNEDDIVIIPAFGTTLEVAEKLYSMNIHTEKYDTTCPFVEKVWNRSQKMGSQGYTTVIHGKHRHEETRATFSHSRQHGPAVIIKDMEEAVMLGKIINGEIDKSQFEEIFRGRFSKNFDVNKDLEKVGVVNQTTMLASETQEIANHLKEVMLKKYGADDLNEHFADTRDTLCYATNDNQEATKQLLAQEADLALVVGGYNSSNTSHLVELLESKFPTYFVNSPDELISEEEIQHYDIHKATLTKTPHYLPGKQPVKIIITSGASCPDSLLDQVLTKLTGFFPHHLPFEVVLESLVDDNF